MGKLVAQIPKFEIHPNVYKRKNTLVGYVLGDKPFYKHLKECVGRLCGEKGDKCLMEEFFNSLEEIAHRT